MSRKSILSLSKDGCPYTNEGAAFLDGDVPVVAHAHGKLFEVRKVSVERRFFKEPAGATEIIADAAGVVGVGSHGHHAGQLYALQLSPFSALDKCLSLVGRETELGLFLCHVQLQQTRNTSPSLQGLLVDFSQQTRGIDSVDERHVGGDVFDLVGLQMADEMPFYALQVGQFAMLQLQFLGMALAEDTLTGSVGLAYSLCRMILRDSHQPHAGWQLLRNLMYFLCNHA